MLVCLSLACGLVAQTLARDPTVVNQFKRQTGHAKGWPGHVVDHIIPLCAGGPDTVGNMEWQTVARSYQKDVFERQLCAAMSRQGLILVKKS